MFTKGSKRLDPAPFSLLREKVAREARRTWTLGVGARRLFNPHPPGFAGLLLPRGGEGVFP